MVKKQRGHKAQAIARLLLTLVILVLLNVVANRVYDRYDLTTEKRYTLSQPTVQLLRNLDDVVSVTVFLEGDFPAGFKRLRNATEDMLYEFNNISNGKVQYRFIDPSAGSYEENQKLYKDLTDRGLNPTNLRVKGTEGSSSKIIFPGLIMRYLDAEIPLQLLENQIGMGPEQVLNNSIELLEYKIANGIKKVTQRNTTRVGVIQGQGELAPIQLSGMVQTLMENKYDVKLVDLPNTLTLVNKFDAIIIAKPTLPYREQDKFKIDQFIMNGGKALFMVEGSNASMDSLRGQPMQMAMHPDANLDDLLFKYGVRINQDLVQDIQCDVIPIVVSASNPPQTEFFRWPFFPVITSYSAGAENTKAPKPHVIAKNLDAVVCKFVSTLDSVRVPNVKKTPILYTSAYSKSVLLPTRIHFSMLKAQLDEKSFTKSYMPIAYLLEGEFGSVFKNRLSAETLEILQDSLENVGFKEESGYNKIIVIGDGDIAANEVSNRGEPYPLGFNPYTEQNFANKDLLLNCMEYLTDNNNLIATRNREVKLRLLDKVKVSEQGLKWQVVNLLVPVLAVLLFGLLFNFMRRRKYAK